VESSDLARDVAQSVFTDLARKAPSLLPKADDNASLMGWLYRSARFEALTLLRGDRRRQARERQAMQELGSTSETSPNWEHVRPALDAAMADLSESDRGALLMRFFKNQDFRSVGTAFGVSDNAAQQRVIRALEKLRKRLVQHGITTTSGSLSIALSGNVVQAAPVGLAAAISTSALLAGTAASTATITAAVKTVAMTTLQKTLITVTIAAAVGTGIYETRQASILRDRLEILQQQQRPLVEQIQQLQLERDDATNRLDQLARVKTAADNNGVELLRLRSEVGTLRQRTNELARLVRGGPDSGEGVLSAKSTEQDATGLTNFPRDSWTFAGFTTPEDALQSYMWAKSRGDVNTAFAAATPELKQAVKEHYFKDKSEEEISSLFMESARSQTGFQIQKKLAAAEDQVVFQVHIDGTEEKSYSLLTLKKWDGEWKVSSAEERPGGN
jgi:RNA polymerase sigma factor (sigma-70 family)